MRSRSPRPKDLESALQVLWLTLTAPRLDTTAVAALRNQIRTALANRGDTPDAVFGDTVRMTMGRYGPRSQPMTLARLDHFDPAHSLSLFEDWFRDFNGFTFVVVGNVNVDSLRPLVEQWIGGLPSHGTAHAWKDASTLPPEGVFTKVVHKGKEPVSQQVVLYTGAADATGPGESLAGAAAAEILQERLLDTLREAMGATYSVSANTSIDRVPRARYRSEITFKSSPAQADTLWLAAQEHHRGTPRQGPDRRRVAEVRGAEPARDRGGGEDQRLVAGRDQQLRDARGARRRAAARGDAGLGRGARRADAVAGAGRGPEVLQSGQRGPVRPLTGAMMR